MHHIIDIRAQKIDNIILKTHKIIVVIFLIVNHIKQIEFFKKIFLIANISLKVVFKMLYFTLNNTNINFLNQNLN